MISWYIDSRSLTWVPPPPLLKSCRPEELLRLPDAVGQRVHLVVGVVKVEAGPGAGLDAERPVQRPRAVVAGPHGDAQLVEDLADVVRVDLRDLEGHRPAAVDGAARAQDPDAGDGRQGLQRVRGERLLVRDDAGHAQAVQVVAGRGQADGLRGR